MACVGIFLIKTIRKKKRIELEQEKNIVLRFFAFLSKVVDVVTSQAMSKKLSRKNDISKEAAETFAVSSTTSTTTSATTPTTPSKTITATLTTRKSRFYLLSTSKRVNSYLDVKKANIDISLEFESISFIGSANSNLCDLTDIQLSNSLTKSADVRPGPRSSGLSVNQLSPIRRTLLCLWRTFSLRL